MQVRILFDKALEFHRAGELEEAARLYREILRTDPRHADSLHLLGVAARQPDLIRQAIAIDGRVAVYHLNLGNALAELGQFVEAIGAYRHAVQIKPDFPEAHFNLAAAHTNLGVALAKAGQRDKAIEAHCEAIRLSPGFAEARFNLGVALHEMGYLDQAISSFDAALQIRPDYAEALTNLGNVLCEAGNDAQSLEAFDAALRLHPGNPETHNGRSVVQLNLGQILESALSAKRALAVRPDYEEAYNNLGNSQRDLGEFRPAEASYNRAIAIDPDYATAYSNLIFFQHYRSDIADETIIAESVRFAKRFARPAEPANRRRPSGRIKIGYVSGDFRRHSVSNFLLPLLRHHDRAAFEVFCYSNNSWRDDVTERIAAGAEHWRQISALDDDRAADMIAADGIDILVDLSGHTAHNRMTLFARRAAPIQATWLGYPGTSGLDEMDFRLVDAITDPPGSGASCTESLIRLDDGFLCYVPVDQASPPRAGDPATRKTRFGSFNNLAKLSDATIALWARLLETVPNSELLLKGRPFADPQIRAGMIERFGRHGITKDRLILLGHIASQGDHLAAYGEIDIALDPFPYNGTTTTCEALWMGVPVVTLLGSRHSGRVGASLLTRVGLESLIAPSERDYIEIAAALAADKPKLADMRRDLQSRVAASPLCDEQDFARRIEAAFLAML